MFAIILLRNRQYFSGEKSAYVLGPSACANFHEEDSKQGAQ